jgi:hypothetical protein
MFNVILTGPASAPPESDSKLIGPLLTPSQSRNAVCVPQLTGRVAPKVNYQQFLTGQSAAFHNEVLGATKARKGPSEADLADAMCSGAGRAHGRFAPGTAFNNR